MKQSQRSGWIIGIIILLVALCLCAAATAEITGSGKCGDNLTWTLEDTGLLTISGTGAMYDYEKYQDVPWYDLRFSVSSLEIGKSVTTLGAYAFYSTNLRTVTIPANIKSIGDHAFWCCFNLNEVTLSEGLSLIDSRAFLSCTGLTEIDIPASVKTLGKYCFECCNKLQKVTLREGLETIGEGVFNVDSSLVSIEIPSTVTSIGAYAFYGNAFTAITIPKGIKSIPESCFHDCGQMTSITIPKSVTEIKNYAFWFADNLKDVYYGGSKSDWKKVTIGDLNEPVRNATIHCQGSDAPEEETSVTVAGGKYELAGNKKSAIFTGPEKKNARTLVIQDTVKINGKKYKVIEVAAGACNGMSKLTTLTIGKNVKTIGKEAFYKCKKAKTIKILGTALKTVGQNAFGGGYSKATVYCAKKKIKAYTKLLQNAGLSKKAVFKELK